MVRTHAPWKDALEEHGEVEVQLENDVVYELHRDVEFVTDDAGVEWVKFTDGDNHEHQFHVGAVVNWHTHPSHRVE